MGLHSIQLTADSVMRRILFVSPRADDTPTDPEEGEKAERVLGASLLFSGVRCVLQYAVLPFILPLIGIAVEVTIPLMFAITLLAIGSIFVSLRHFWRVDYKYKWQYLGVALVALAVLFAFGISDIVIMSA